VLLISLHEKGARKPLSNLETQKLKKLLETLFSFEFSGEGVPENSNNKAKKNPPFFRLDGLVSGGAMLTVRFLWVGSIKTS
jgi:hypothetical protein